MNKQLRAMVIGAGQAGEGHTVALRYAGVDVTTICSRTLAVVSEVAKRLRIPHASSDWRASLENELPDIVAIATPASARVEPISAAVELGCHVYSDKPLAVTAADARLLYELALKKGVRTAVAANWMYDPGIAYLRDLVAAGAIGQPFAVESHFVNPWPFPSAAMWINRVADGGGVLNNRMSHQLSAAQRIVGGEVLQVMGEARTHRRTRPDTGQPHDYRQWRTLSATEVAGVPWVEVDADDSCIVVARLGQPGDRPENTITLNLYCCSSIRGRDGRTITVYGEDGSLHYDWVHDPKTNAAQDGRPFILRTGFASADWKEDPVPEHILQSLPQISHGLHRDWAALAREFTADIRGEAFEPYPTFRQGWIYQEITDVIRKGSGWVDIPQDISKMD